MKKALLNSTGKPVQTNNVFTLHILLTLSERLGYLNLADFALGQRDSDFFLKEFT